MTLLKTLAHRALMCLALLAPTVALAAPTSYFLPYLGQGNVSVFDATAGTGGWVGSIDEVPAPSNPQPLSLVSVVLFTLDSVNHTLSGSFEFTTTDLLNTLTGDLIGSYVNDDILNLGGQFSLDYRILAGTGLFEGANGFGLAFVDFDPLTAFNNYQESGVLVFNVPAPATLALVLAGLAAVAVSRRKARPVN